MNTAINPGIIETVRWLNENGFETMDSGDGETHVHECDQPFAYVHILTEATSIAKECQRLKCLLQELGIEIEPMNEDGTAKTIEAHYNAADGIATITLWNVKL